MVGASMPSTEQTGTPLLVVSLVFTTRLPAPPLPARSTFTRSAQLRVGVTTASVAGASADDAGVSPLAVGDWTNKSSAVRRISMTAAAKSLMRGPKSEDHHGVRLSLRT